MKKLLTLLCLCMTILLGACSSASGSDTMTVSLLKAGKADAIIIETSEGAVLIDTGLEENSDQLLAELAERNITELYAMIITHFDKDHVGGADAVLEAMDVKYIYTTYQTKESDDIEEFESALEEAGKSAVVISGTQNFEIGNAVFEMIGASGDYDEDESNNSSLIVRVTFGSKTYLFMGDAQDERIEEFLSADDADADFLKVPYHGHNQDTLADLLEAVTPQVSVICNSEDEPEASELKKTIKKLNAVNSEVYQTAQGTVTLTCTAEDFTVSQ